MKLTALLICAMLTLNAHAESEKDSDEALVAAAEKLMTEGKPVKTEDVPEEAAIKADAENPALASDIKNEATIPVFAKSEKQNKSESSLMWRLFGSLAFVAMVGGGLIFAARRWTTKKNKGGEKARIEILHQFHMGPKKSIALIRVAGEALLIGCTDQSINLLKTVTLIDEELETLMGGKDFNQFLDDDFSVEDVRNIKSRVQA